MAQEQSFNLSQEKRELLARLLREKGLSDKRPSLSIPPRPSDISPPLSFSQERLWYLEKLMPGNIAYNIPVAVHLTGPLDIAALHQSLNRVIARHELLRTTFDLEAAASRQTIQQTLTIPLPLEDYTAGSGQDLQQALTAEARRPFDLQTGPLLRARLLKTGAEQHIFLFTIHHIIADGWSLAVFFRELSQFYAALVDGRIPQLPPVPQYPDFAHWQRQRLSGDLLHSQMAYWLEQLGGSLPELVLPQDNPRPATPTFRGRWHTQTIPPKQLAALKTLAQSEGTTLFVVLLAAYKTLLHRYSGQEEIIVGSPVTNRIQHDLENVIGHFINTLVLRTDLSGALTFRGLLHRQKQVVLDAYSNQDIPFEYLLDTLQPARDPRKNPLFQSVFILQDIPAQANWRTALKLPNIETRQLFTHNQTAKLDLTLEAEILNGELALSFEYNSDIFSPETIERLAGHFQQLLAGLAADPDKRLSEYSLITAEEQRRLNEWNDTTTPFPGDECVQTIFEKHAARTPHAPALIQGQKQLTYAELNCRANHLAHRLRQLGVGPDIAVGICARRSFAFVTGVLAILKAGGSYMPLDPNYPQDRVKYMLDKTRAPVLLLDEEQVGKLRYESGETLILEEVLKETHTAENPPLLTSPNHTAYIMFTSGSTGQPKGASIPHNAINRLVCNPNYITFEPDDVIAHISSIAFDAATFEIWGALLNGLPLAVITRETALVPEALETFLVENRVSVLFLTTSLFNYVAYNRPQLFKHLRVAMFGGETGDPQAVAIIREINPTVRLINCYGPTESTTFTTCYPIQEAPRGAKTVLIGRPVSNTTVHILDQHLNPVPPAIPGELYIGGKGLAHHYYGMPARTAAVFIPDPFSDEPGARLYKTGDLVVLRPDPDGRTHYAVDYLGRIDNQIKMRGFRIELSEIETVLQQFPAVQESVVLAREDNPGDTRLVAYLVAETGKTISQIELRRHLHTRLPDYMIPAAIITLDALPLTTNGKVDWRKLPPPTLERPVLETQFAAPQSETEQTIAAIWQDILQLQQVGRYDNFFDLGGNSLLLVKIHHQLQETFNRKIPIVQLFTDTTIAALANYMNQSKSETPGLNAPAITSSLDRGQRRRERMHRRK